MKGNEEASSFVNLSPEQLLLRWFNHHLERVGQKGDVKNFSQDLRDSTKYCYLFHSLSFPNALEPLKEKDLVARAELLIKIATQLNCSKYITPKDIIEVKKG